MQPDGWFRRADVERGRSLRFFVDGQELVAYEGETVAAALLAAGRLALRQTARRGQLRGVFCGMGVCFDCLISINGQPNRQACLIPVEEGMRVEIQKGERWDPAIRPDPS